MCGGWNGALGGSDGAAGIRGVCGESGAHGSGSERRVLVQHLLTRMDLFSIGDTTLSGGG